ncbi:MAG: DUF4190 domain-containing protein [Ruminococcaceae bacterium]|nr:DUF4190 domain-containing protein [Oscillospiraceae bacterium]
MFCKNCGASCPEGAMFCANCGSPIPAPAEAVEPIEQTPVAPIEVAEFVEQEPVAPIETAQPVEQAPVTPEPSYQQPVYQQPVYQQSAYQQPVYQQPVYQQPAQQPTGVPGKGFGITAMILGILGLVCPVYFIPQLLAVIFGAISRSKSNRAGIKNGMATAGLATGIIALILWLLFFLFIWLPAVIYAGNSYNSYYYGYY